jgi:hypothetical protein
MRRADARDVMARALVRESPPTLALQVVAEYPPNENTCSDNR